MEFEEPSAAHLEVLRKIFGHKEFKGIQWSNIRALLYDKRDCCVIASTGFGKSLIYQYPPVFEGKLVIVISPLIALMQDQVASLKAKGIRACFFGSEQPNKTLRMADHNLCYITPEYLQFKAHLMIQEVRDRILFFAIDEAHIVEQWRDFRKEYKKLNSLRLNYPEIPIIALTATAPQYVQDYVTRLLMMREDFYLVKTALDRPNLEFEVRQSSGDYVTQVLPLLREVKDGSAIVYCIPQAGTELMSAKFNSFGLDCRPYHSKLKKEVKAKVVEDFRTNKLKFVVSTIAFGMGIDKPDVRLVVHYGMAKSIEAYYQEAGRAGRDGKPSKCIVFLDSRDISILRKFVNDSEEVTELEKRQQYYLIDMFHNFLLSKNCRRIAMLEYLGTTDEERAKLTIRDNCCDNCKRDLQSNVPVKMRFCDINEDGTFDFTSDARKLLKAVHPKLLRREILDNILGNQPNLSNYRYFKLQAHGTGRNCPAGFWENLLSLLITKGYLSVVGNTLRLERKSKHLLQFKGRKLLAAPTLALQEYLKKKENVEFFWDNGVIRSRLNCDRVKVSLMRYSEGDEYDEDLMDAVDKAEKSFKLEKLASTSSIDSKDDRMKPSTSAQANRLQEKRELDNLQFLDFDSGDDEGMRKPVNKRGNDSGYDKRPKKVQKTAPKHIPDF